MAAGRISKLRSNEDKILDALRAEYTGIKTKKDAIYVLGLLNIVLSSDLKNEENIKTLYRMSDSIIRRLKQPVRDLLIEQYNKIFEEWLI